MASPLQAITSVIQASSGSVPDLKKLHAHLVSSQEELIQHMPYLDEAALALNPTAHTLGLIFILNCKGMAMPLSDPTAVGLFIEQCRRMLLGLDPEQVPTARAHGHTHARTRASTHARMHPRACARACTSACAHTGRDGPAAGSPRAEGEHAPHACCLLYTSPSPRDLSTSRMPSSA